MDQITNNRAAINRTSRPSPKTRAYWSLAGRATHGPQQGDSENRESYLCCERRDWRSHSRDEQSPQDDLRWRYKGNQSPWRAKHSGRGGPRTISQFQCSRDEKDYAQDYAGY